MAYELAPKSGARTVHGVPWRMRVSQLTVRRFILEGCACTLFFVVEVALLTLAD